MSFSRRYLSVPRGARRRACSLLLLCAYTVTATGFPLPVGKPPKTSELFPCATSSCGCNSAEACWRSCCCHTLAERLAWARDNKVTPPAFAIADAQRAGLDLSWREGKVVSPRSSAQKTCCETPTKLSGNSCCQAGITPAETRSRSCCCSAHQPAAKAGESQRQVVGWQAMKCHGQSFDWLAATPSLVMDRPVPPSFPSLVVRLGPEHFEEVTSPSYDPVQPPPETA